MYIKFSKKARKATISTIQIFQIFINSKISEFPRHCLPSFQVLATLSHGAPNSKKRFHKAPIVLDNQGWTPLTVIEHIVDDVAQHHIKPDLQARESIVYSAPTPIPVYAQPIVKRKSVPAPAAVVRRKKSSPIDRSGKVIPIISHNKKVSQSGDRKYHFDFKSENGITRTEDGYLKPVDSSKYPAQVMSGSYSYTGPDGNVS